MLDTLPPQTKDYIAYVVRQTNENDDISDEVKRYINERFPP